MVENIRMVGFMPALNAQLKNTFRKRPLEMAAPILLSSPMQCEVGATTLSLVKFAISLVLQFMRLVIAAY